MKIPFYRFDILRRDGLERFGPGTRMQITAGWGVTVVEWFQKDGPLAGIPLDRDLLGVEPERMIQ